MLKGVHDGPVEEPDTDAAELIKIIVVVGSPLNPKFLNYLPSKLTYLLYANFLICININSKFESQDSLTVLLHRREFKSVNQPISLD